MQKINWVNGQMGGTPLSAENLNLMQDYIENAINGKNIMQVTMSGNWNISANNTYVKVPFNTVTYNTGSGLTFSNGVITVGAGISKIKVTSRLGISKNSAGVCYNRIRHTSSNVSLNSENTVNQYGGASQRAGVSCEFIYDVEQGDTFQVETYGSTSDQVTGGVLSYMLVEAIV